ncbi:MAG TPA: FAD-dependent oxidoreductase, partial [Candidatus Limnocylindrales bacterium]|nr:FAD-dependent oxidoreductase [Candidatus Limnocylindrales bacterium]
MSTTSPDWGKTPWHISFHGKLSRLPGHVDIAIIGGGFTGLAAAAIAKRLAPKKSVLLLEAKRVGNGASGRTGGMVLGETAAGNLPGLGDVLKGYRKILRELGVSANLKLPGVWEIARSSHSMDGKRIKPLQNSPIDWNDSGRVRIVKKVPGGAVDPGKVIDGLARAAVRAGAVIAEGAEVTRIDTTNPIRIHVSLRRKRTKIVAATRVLLATNAGGLNLAGKIFTT